MKLKTFLEGLPRGGSAKLAGALGVSAVYLMQLAARQGGREPGPELSVRIEAATELQVRRWDLRPSDWHLIWPELIGVDGAPHCEQKSTGHAFARTPSLAPRLASEVR